MQVLCAKALLPIIGLLPTVLPWRRQSMNGETGYRAADWAREARPVRNSVRQG